MWRGSTAAPRGGSRTARSGCSWPEPVLRRPQADRGASRKGHALIDRRLYLPEGWAGDAERRRAAKIPEAVGFQTKPELARAMIARALAAGVPCALGGLLAAAPRETARPPPGGRGVLGDAVYGADRRLRAMLEERGKPYLLGMRGNDRLKAGLGGEVGPHEPEALARALLPQAWRPLRRGWLQGRAPLRLGAGAAAG